MAPRPSRTAFKVVKQQLCLRLRPSGALDHSLQLQTFLFASRQGHLRAHEEVFRVTQAEDMASAKLPVFQKADGTDDQLNLQIDEDAAFHTTLHWLRVDSHGRCTQTPVGRRISSVHLKPQRQRPGDFSLAGTAGGERLGRSKTTSSFSRPENT